MLMLPQHMTYTELQRKYIVYLFYLLGSRITEKIYKTGFRKL